MDLARFFLSLCSKPQANLFVWFCVTYPLSSLCISLCDPPPPLSPFLLPQLPVQSHRGAPSLSIHSFI